MPLSGKRKFLIEGRCALTGYVKVKALVAANFKAIRAFIDEVLISNYGLP